MGLLQWLIDIFFVLTLSGICPSAYGSLRTASLQISSASALKWSGTYYMAYGPASTAFSHISCVLRYSGINLKGCKHFSIVLEHISWVLKRGGTSFNSHGAFQRLCCTFFGLLSHQGQVLKSLALCTITSSIEHILTPGSDFMLHFHNPRPQVHRENLRCWLHAQQLKKAQENCQKYTLKDNLS